MIHNFYLKTLSLLLCAAVLPLTGFAQDQIPEDLKNNPNIAQIEVFQSTNANYDPRPSEPFPVDYRGENDLWGLKSEDGIILTEPVWDSIRHFEGVNFLTVKKDSKWGIVNQTGSVVMEPQYKEIRAVNAPMYETVLLRVLTFEDKYGILDLDLNQILPPIYDFIDSEIYEDTIEVGRDYGYTLVDLTGKELLPLQKNWVHKTASPEYFLCGSKDNSAFYLINRSGELVTKNAYQTMELAGNDAAIISENGLYGLVDFDGKLLISCQYERITQLNSSVLFATAGETSAYYDLTGRLIGGRSWETPGLSWYHSIADTSLPPEQMLYLVKEQNKYGYINYQGDLVISPQYEDANGYFVQINGKTGLLSADGSYLVKPRWNLSPSTFNANHGYYSFYLENSEGSSNLKGLMNPKGEVLIEASNYQIYFGVNDWLFIHDQETQTVYHVTLNENITPLSDEALCNPPVIAAAVDTLTANGILRGNESGDLQLNQTISRAEFLTLLARLDGWTDIEETSTFIDVKGHWAEGIVAAAVRRGLVTGYTDGGFGPDDAVTARQALTILFRARNCPEMVFSDDWLFSDAYSYSKFTLGHGFSRDESITRQDAAVLLNSYQKSTVDLSTKDFDLETRYTDDQAPSFHL